MAIKLNEEIIYLPERSKYIYCFLITLLFIVLVCSCNTAAPDAKDDLLNSLKGSNVEGYHFMTTENDTQVVASFTNSAVQELIKLDSDTANVVLRYTSVKDKKTNTTKNYKTEILKADNDLTLLVTEIESGKDVIRQKFPSPTKHNNSNGNDDSSPIFKSLEECLNDFDCKRRGTLQCEANRTCQAQFASLLCPIKEGEFISVHLIIKPTSFRCKLNELIPKIEGVMLVKTRK